MKSNKLGSDRSAQNMSKLSPLKDYLQTVLITKAVKHLKRHSWFLSVSYELSRKKKAKAKKKSKTNRLQLNLHKLCKNKTATINKCPVMLFNFDLTPNITSF